MKGSLQQDTVVRVKDVKLEHECSPLRPAGYLPDTFGLSDLCPTNGSIKKRLKGKCEYLIYDKVLPNK